MALHRHRITWIVVYIQSSLGRRAIINTITHRSVRPTSSTLADKFYISFEDTHDLVGHFDGNFQSCLKV